MKLLINALLNALPGWLSPPPPGLVKVQVKVQEF